MDKYLMNFFLILLNVFWDTDEHRSAQILFSLKITSNLRISVGICVLCQQQIYHTNKQAGVANIKISYEKH